MKRSISILAMAAGLVFLFPSCKDKAAEKRIAELESRLAQLETNKTANTTATPAANTIPTMEIARAIAAGGADANPYAAPTTPARPETIV